MIERAGLVLRIERTFDAPAQDVYDAWTSEEVLRRWIHAGPDWSTPVAEVDLRVGGELRIVMRRPDGTDEGATGEYREVDPPNRLVFTWTWDRDPQNPLLIELDFTERDGETIVVLTNSGLPNEDERRSHEEGWQLCFDNLDRVLAR
jgi:uncharacterized protein YndB with AHSA1/START domain